MIIAKYHGVCTVSKENTQTDANGLVIGPKFVKSGRVRYTVDADTPEEIDAYLATQTKPAFLDEEQTIPLWYSSEIYPDGVVELAISKKGFVYAKDEFALAMDIAMKKADEHTIKVLATHRAEAILDNLKTMFPRKTLVLNKKASTPSGAAAQGETGQQ